jgi:predicted lipid-binding transport protein (Tim44 family)
MDPLTIIIIAVAAILGWWLWSVLGQRTGFERKLTKPNEAPQILSPKTIDQDAGLDRGKVPSSSWEKHANPDTSLGKGLASICNRERSFDADAFLAGAAKAYELINVAFAKGDKKTLQGLLSRDLMRDFAVDIDRRSAASEKMAWQLVKVEATKLEDASLVGNTARLSVHFVSSVISATTDKEGKVVEGHLTAIEKVEDAWSFERAVNLSDPNWKLFATTPQ